MLSESNYSKYRGKCKEYVDKLCAADSSLTPVRGHYICWAWGKQAHWWAVTQEGTIVDPTVNQFPKPHIGDYVPFNGLIDCEECGKQVPEKQAYIDGHHAFCSGRCFQTHVGL